MVQNLKKQLTEQNTKVIATRSEKHDTNKNNNELNGTSAKIQARRTAWSAYNEMFDVRQIFNEMFDFQLMFDDRFGFRLDSNG